MHYVSLIVEFLRGRPAVVFWTAALSQAFLWLVLPALFYSAPPGQLPDVLAIGHEFRLGSYLGPPLAFWLAELCYRMLGAFGVYLLAQACVVLAFWAVFALGRSIVGTRHAVLAILLMTGIAAFSVPSPDFGPAILAMPLWALAVLHYWRAVGERRRGYWFCFAFEIGLLLLTSYVGLILLFLFVVFSSASACARAAFKFAEPWISFTLILFVLTPHLVWLYQTGLGGLASLGQVPRLSIDPSGSARLFGSFVFAHLGFLVLVVLASGWPRKRRERAPVIERNQSELFGRIYIYFFASLPVLVAGGLALLIGRVPPVENVAPLALLSGLAAIALVGQQVQLYRERYVSFAWLVLLTLPPVLVVAGIVVLPWTLATDLRIAQPAGEMGRFFGDNFQRRTGQPLSIVGGDQQLASLIALGAPSRPSVLLDETPAFSPWVTAEQLREKGGLLVWRPADTSGAPPAELKQRFPDLVAEVPRVFARPVQGLLPLIRVGWAVIRPAASAPPAR